MFYWKWFSQNILVFAPPTLSLSCPPRPLLTAIAPPIVTHLWIATKRLLTIIETKNQPARISIVSLAWKTNTQKSQGKWNWTKEDERFTLTQSARYHQQLPATVALRSMFSEAAKFKQTISFLLYLLLSITHLYFKFNSLYFILHRFIHSILLV